MARVTVSVTSVQVVYDLQRFLDLLDDIGITHEAKVSISMIGEISASTGLSFLTLSSDIPDDDPNEG